MSNRVRHRGRRPTRSTGRSYTERLQRTKAYRPPRQFPTWLSKAHWINQPRVPALLILLAEAGHLAAAWTEWPAATARGVFHVVVAGILGIAAVTIYFNPTRIPLGIAATVLVPVCWMVGALVGSTPYRHYPVIAAGVQTTVELVAGAMLALGHLTLRTPQVIRRPGRGERHDVGSEGATSIATSRWPRRRSPRPTA